MIDFTGDKARFRHPKQMLWVSKVSFDLLEYVGENFRDIAYVFGKLTCQENNFSNDKSS